MWRPPAILLVAAFASASILGLLLSGTLPLPLDTRDMLFILLGVAAAGIAVASPAIGIHAVIGFFVFSAFFRRLVPASNPSVDFAAIVPFLVAVPLAARAVTIKRPIEVSLFLGWITISAGLSLTKPLESIAGWLDYSLPLLIAFAVWRTPRGIEILASSTVICGTVAALYGIAQYFIPFHWDVRWLVDTEFVSAGRFGTASFRPFSTLPAPRTAAMLSGIVLLLVLFRTDIVRIGRFGRSVALTSSAVFVLLAQVRATWISIAAALFVGVVVSRQYRFQRLVLPAVLVIVGVTLLPQGQVIVRRATTIFAFTDDVSYRSRVQLIQSAGGFLSPLGNGLGRLSSGNRVNEGTALENGYLIVMGETGLVGLGAFLALLARTARRLKESDYPFFTMMVVSSFGGLLTAGFSGLLLWPLAGLGRTSVQQDEPPVVNVPVL